MTEKALVKKDPMEAMRQTITALKQEFAAALPPQIPVDRFVRTVITTLQMNPDILSCDRKSVLATCMKAAQDGLLLDGREAAAVKYGSNCVYIPMVGGILKKMRNSGDIASVDVQTVYQNDHFVYELGLNPKLEHRPIITGERGPSICWYAIVRIKDGGTVIEVMNREDIEKVRKVSKAKREDAPWFAWYEEMAEKTCLKRVAKRCPSSADLQQLIDHDNEVTGFVQKGTVEPATDVDARPTFLRALAESESVDEKTGEVKDATVEVGTAAGKGAQPNLFGREPGEDPE